MNRNSGTYLVTDNKMSSSNNNSIVAQKQQQQSSPATWLSTSINTSSHIAVRSAVPPPGGHVSRSRAPHNQKVRRNRTKPHKSPAPLPGPWRDSGGWTQSFANNRPSPINTQDISPGFAQRKVVLLAEKRKFTDASQLLNQLNVGTLKAVSTNLPLRLFIECIPDSLIVLESIYSRLFIISADDFPVDELLVEGLVFHIVRYMAMRDSLRDTTNPTPEEALKSVTNILRIVLYVNPELVRTLYSRKKLMESSLKGIGEHSMISMKGQLMNLHDALKDEFDNTIVQYKTALQKLEVLNLSKSKPLTSRSFRKKRPSESNHQELMKLTRDQIQERLYKNKTILNAVEASLYNRLPKLLQVLQDRIEFDKNALLAFGRLQKEITSIPANTKVAPVIAQYTKGLKKVLDIFRNLLDVHGSETSSNLGYATDEQEDEQVIQLEEDRDADVQIPAPSTPPSQLVTTEEENSASDSTQNGHISLRDRPPHKAPSQRRIRQQQEQHAQERRSRSEERKTWRRGSFGRSKERARSRSVERGAISRPRRDSVNDSQQFQQMMKRINKVSASSPAVGRRSLIARGVSPSHSRESSISPTFRRRLASDAAHSIMSQKKLDELLQSKFPDYKKPPASDSDSSTSRRKKRLRTRRSRTESRSRSRSRTRSNGANAAHKSDAVRRTNSEMNVNATDNAKYGNTNTKYGYDNAKYGYDNAKYGYDYAKYGYDYAKYEYDIADYGNGHAKYGNDDTKYGNNNTKYNRPFSRRVEAHKENNGSLSSNSDEPGTPKASNKSNDEKDALLREERAMRQTLEKERHRLLMSERDLMAQVEQLKRELSRAKKETERLQHKQREDKLVRRLSINSTNSNIAETPIFIQEAPPSLPAPKPVRYSIGDLLYEYDKLYTEERAEAWAALPDITDVDDFEENHEKKDRLLFSSIELSFGTAQTYLHQIMTGDRSVKAEGASGLDDDELLHFLQKLGDNFDITDMVTDVQTLIEHAAGNLEIPRPMAYFSNHCVKLAWKLTIQTPPYVIDASSRSFDSIKHQRAPGSDRKNSTIKKHIWPCLLESDSLQCVYKGVVVT